MNLVNKQTVQNSMGKRLVKNQLARSIFFLAAGFGMLVLAVLLYRIFQKAQAISIGAF